MINRQNKTRVEKPKRTKYKLWLEDSRLMHVISKTY